MRHRKKTVKLGRSQAHRDALLAGQVCSLIEHYRIKTTVAKAKAVRPLAEHLVSLGRQGTLHARRMALAVLHSPKAVKKLFEDVAPRTGSRPGGFTRIVRLGPRKSDSAPIAYLEWVDAPAAEPAPEVQTAEQAQPTEAKKPKAARKAKAEGDQAK
jgi:large subunit ribosomal protein L17